MVLKKFSPIKIAFLAQNKAKLGKILIITLFFFRKTPFIPPKICKNRRKL
jgi:hypothetical protein